MGFSREGRKIIRGSSSSISVRRSLTRRRRPCVTPFVAGICLGAVTKLSKTCRGCSTRSSGVGSSITGGTIARHFIRRCAHWIEILPSGPSANTRSCTNICAERRTGSPVFRGALRSCSHTGTWGCGVAPCWELYESRGSRTVLREPRGEIPRGYSPQYLRGERAGRETSHAQRDQFPPAPTQAQGERGEERGGATAGAKVSGL